YRDVIADLRTVVDHVAWTTAVTTTAALRSDLMGSSRSSPYASLVPLSLWVSMVVRGFQGNRAVTDPVDVVAALVVRHGRSPQDARPTTTDSPDLVSARGHREYNRPGRGRSLGRPRPDCAAGRRVQSGQR